MVLHACSVNEHNIYGIPSKTKISNVKTSFEVDVKNTKLQKSSSQEYQDFKSTKVIKSRLQKYKGHQVKSTNTSKVQRSFKGQMDKGRQGGKGPAVQRLNNSSLLGCFLCL